MKNLLIAMSVLAIAGSSAFAIPVPHPVYVSVDNMDGLTPASDDLLFNAWLTARPTEIGNQDSFDWGYGEAAPGLLSVNCGNVFSTWIAGDVLHIEAVQPSTGYTGIGEYTLTNDNMQVFSGSSGITLTPEPTMMCLFGLGGLGLMRRKRSA